MSLASLPDEIPDAQATLEQYQEFLQLFREALEYGAHVAREFFETHHGASDHGLFAHILRWSANEYLHAKGHDLIDFVQEKVNGSGLSFLVAGAHMKSWKAVDGEMPRAQTLRRKVFCRQIIQLRLQFPDLDKMGPVLRNVALLWQLDGKQNLSSIEMLKPKTGDVRKGEQYWIWRVRLPDIFTSQMPVQSDIVDDQDDLEGIGLPESNMPDVASEHLQSDQDD